jgi:hypothetical protein
MPETEVRDDDFFEVSILGQGLQDPLTSGNPFVDPVSGVKGFG